MRRRCRVIVKFSLSIYLSYSSSWLTDLAPLIFCTCCGLQISEENKEHTCDVRNKTNTYSISESVQSILSMHAHNIMCCNITKPSQCSGVCIAITRANPSAHSAGQWNTGRLGSLNPNAVDFVPLRGNREHVPH